MAKPQKKKKKREKNPDDLMFFCVIFLNNTAIYSLSVDCSPILTDKNEAKFASGVF